MKALLSALLALAATLAMAQEFKLGSTVTDFPLADLKGHPVHFAQLKADTTVVMFIATRCPVSNAYNERMSALYRDYSAKGVHFVFVNANFNEPASEVEEHARSSGFPFPVYKDQDDAVANRFGAQVTPEAFVIDRTGVIRYHGSIDDSQNPARIRFQGLRTALDAVLQGKPVATQETKAFGCTIKRKQVS